MRQKPIYLNQAERELVAAFMRHGIVELENETLLGRTAKVGCKWTRGEMIKVLAKIQPTPNVEQILAKKAAS